MTATAVDPRMNDARHEGAGCAEPAADDLSGRVSGARVDSQTMRYA
jgi:hypothetical protein